MATVHYPAVQPLSCVQLTGLRAQRGQIAGDLRPHIRVEEAAQRPRGLLLAEGLCPFRIVLGQLVIAVSRKADPPGMDLGVACLHGNRPRGLSHLHVVLSKSGLTDLERLIGTQLIQDEPPSRRGEPVAAVAGMVGQGSGRLESLFATPAAAGQQRKSTRAVGIEQPVDPEYRLARNPLGQRPGKPALPVRLRDLLSGSELLQVVVEERSQGGLADRPAGSCPANPAVVPVHRGGYHRIAFRADSPADLVSRDQLVASAPVLEGGRGPMGLLGALFELCPQLGGQPGIKPVVLGLAHRLQVLSLPGRSAGLVVTAPLIIERHCHITR